MGEKGVLYRNVGMTANREEVMVHAIGMTVTCDQVQF